ncbi:MAG: ACP S-malonyltransferase [Candidatus Omnitrophota bacterium]
MKDVAFIFPGQGAQYVGMGKEIHDEFPAAQTIFKKANEALGFDITRLCFEGPEQELKPTLNCQPAIFTVSIACLEALYSQRKSKHLNPNFMSGLSLGEYSALAAANAFSFQDGLRLVRQRAEFMEQEAKKNPGKMAAVLGMDVEKVKVICGSAGTQIANLNCPGQVVISGRQHNIDKAAELVKSEGAKFAILEVSGGFHSFLMKDAGKKLANLLDDIELKEPDIPVISNVTANPEIVLTEIRMNLIEQICSPVRWEDSVRYMVSAGIREFLEVGPGKILKGMLKRIDPELKVYNIEKPQDIEDLPV